VYLLVNKLAEELYDLQILVEAQLNICMNKQTLINVPRTRGNMAFR